MVQKLNKPVFVDTHAHLDFDSFDNDRDAVVKNARLANLGAIINIGINLDTSKKSIALAEKHDMIYATVGVHPHDADEMHEEWWPEIIRLYNHPRVVAIGEIGLDYYRDYSPHDVQRKILLRQLDLAVEHNLPVIIHTRSAWPDILPIVTSDDYRHKLRGVFHCFSGSKEQAQAVLDLDYHISFTGVVTFKNASALTIAAEYVPLNRLMLETDCPFMAPVPYRGKRCEPAYVPVIADKIAEAKNLKVADLALQTTANAQNLFGIKI